MSIPKIIHYCWFGKKDKNEKIKKYIETWEKYLPEYEIKEWNEYNFEVNCNQYVKEAYNEKKYAFVSDYARLYALYEYGGIYFDTDVEVIKNFDNLLNCNCDIYGLEREDTIMTGVMIAQKNSIIIRDMLKHYQLLKFINDDGTLNLMPNTKVFTQILKEYGLEEKNRIQKLKENAIVYPIEYFSAYDMDNSCFDVTKNTYSIHHCDGSWTTSKQRLIKKIKRRMSKILGKKIYETIRIMKNKGEKNNGK